MTVASRRAAKPERCKPLLGETDMNLGRSARRLARDTNRLAGLLPAHEPAARRMSCDVSG
jgi:hypothetical protein